MSIEGDPRVSEADLAVESEEADTESGIRAAEFDLDKFRRQCVAVHEMLNQGTYWIDVHGRRHAIRDMSVGYKANCLAFMRARVGYFSRRYPWGAIWAMDLPSGWAEVRLDADSGGVVPGRPVSRGAIWLDDGGNMSHAFDQYIEDLEERIRRSPGDWLDDTPLMKALSDQVLAGEGGAIGDRPEDQPREVTATTPCPTCGQKIHATFVHRRSGVLARLCTGEWVRIVR